MNLLFRNRLAVAAALATSLLGFQAAAEIQSPDSSGLAFSSTVLTFQADPGSLCHIAIPGETEYPKPVLLADHSGLARLYVRTTSSAKRLDVQAVCKSPAGETRVIPRSIGPADFDAWPALSPRVPRQLEATSTIGVLSAEHIDVTTASEEQLKALGYPRRPDPVEHPRAYQVWLYAVTTPGAYVRSRPIPIDGMHHHPIERRTPSRDSRETVAQNGQLVNAAASSLFFTTATWSGYAIANPAKPFNEVAGVWKVPVVVNQGFMVAASSEWVGLDGFGTGDVVQTGTAQDTYAAYIGASGFWEWSTYYAWFEWYPEGEEAFDSLVVSPGDQVFGYVVMLSPTSTEFILLNQSTGECAIQDKDQPWYAPPFTGQTVEWIMERPQAADGSIYPLAKYDTAIMTNAIFGRANGIDGYYDTEQHYQIMMTSNGTVNGTLLSFAWPYTAASGGIHFAFYRTE